MTAVARQLRILLEGTDQVVAARVVDARSFPLRLRGLLGRPAPGEDEGLLLRPCDAVHTWFMSYTIDAVFLDADGWVLEMAEDMVPWRRRRVPGAYSVLELRAGTARARGLAEGARVRWEPTYPS